MRTRADRRRRRPVSLAIVQHAHQYLITDGYENREGISQILDAFTAILALHLRYRVPLNLHVSGLLLESIAWHRPMFFEWLHALAREGLLELIGSSYAQNIMPLFDDGHNARQVRECLDCYRRLLNADVSRIKGFWVPERVWNTERLAPVITDVLLPNGGYEYVLLDDRLTYSRGSRRRFDRSGAPAGERDHLHAFGIADASLAVLPISMDLRYSIPPREAQQWRSIRDTLRQTGRAGSDAIAVFADDLERSAAVGLWSRGKWSSGKVSPYERLLRWIAREPRLDAALLSDWLARHPPADARVVEPGTYYELARDMGAGETYARWWRGAAWRPYREMLARVETRLREAPTDAEPCGLRELAWKQLLASSFETGWHDVAKGKSPKPAPWARACASHARAALVIACAADWESRRVGRAHAERVDVDEDGDDEIVLKNDRLFAVLSPAYGARLIYLFDYACRGGRLVVGNPADDWNWQEELNRFMLVPRNHPGCFADVGHENDRYRVRRRRATPELAEVVLVNASGMAKVFRLAAKGRSIEVEYRLPAIPERFRVECALSPDYLALLRHGRARLRRARRDGKRGWQNSDAAAWVQPKPGDPVLWDEPLKAEAGHALVLCVAAYGKLFTLRVGVGAE